MGGPLCSSVGISVGKEWRSGILRSDAEGSADASLDTSCFGLAGLAGKARLWPLIDVQLPVHLIWAQKVVKMRPGERQVPPRPLVRLLGTWGHGRPERHLTSRGIPQSQCLITTLFRYQTVSRVVELVQDFTLYLATSASSHPMGRSCPVCTW